MSRFIVSLIFAATLVVAEDLNNMPFGGGVSGSTLPPPFGLPGSFGSTPMPFGMGGMNMNQPQPHFGQPQFPYSPNAFPSQPMPNQPFQPVNQGFGSLSGFTNGFAPNLPGPVPTGMFPPQIGGGFPSTPGPFNPIGSVTPRPIVKKRQAGFQGSINGQIPNSISGEINSFGQHPFGIPNSANMGLNNGGTYQNSNFPQAFPGNGQGNFGANAALGSNPNPMQQPIGKRSV